MKVLSSLKVFFLVVILSTNVLTSVSTKTNDSKNLKDDLTLPDRQIKQSSIFKTYLLRKSNYMETKSNHISKKANLTQRKNRNLVITHNAKITGTTCGTDNMTMTCAGGGYFYSIRHFICGTGYSGGANNDCSVMQFSESNLATPTWQYYFGANGSTENCSGGCVADDSGVWILSDSNSTINGITPIGGNSAFVIKLTPTMTVKYTVRSNNYDSNSSTAGFHGIAQDPENIYTTGRGNGGNNTYV